MTAEAGAVMMKCVGLASDPDRPLAIIGQYLKEFDLEFADGRGSALWTADPELALTWHSLGEAMSYWKQRSRVRPTRPDGQPNRPLTAFTVEIVPVQSLDHVV